MNTTKKNISTLNSKSKKSKEIIGKQKLVYFQKPLRKDFHITTKTQDGKLEILKTIAKYRRQYLKDCEKYGLKKEWLGQKIVIEEKEYKIVGFDRNASYYKVAAVRNKVRYKIPISIALNYFKEKD